MSSTIHSFRQRSYYLRKRMFCLSTGLWALGTPKSEYALGTVSTLGWEINMSWSPLASKHPRGRDVFAQGPQALGPELLVDLEPWVKVCWGRSVSFHTRRHFSYSCYSLLPAQLLTLRAPQAASIGTAPSCHTQGSTRLWLRVILVPLRQPLPLNINSVRCSIIMNEQK